MKMNKYIKLSALFTAFCCLTISCEQDDDKLGESVLTDTLPYTPNATDHWLKGQFEEPYNIAVLYRWKPGYVDGSRYLFPPYIDNVKPAMEMVRKLWVDTYETVGGPTFLKKLSPKEIVLIGGVNKNPTGTVTLGYAEAGARITFFETDDVVKFIQDPTKPLAQKKAKVRLFIQTIQHEYIHILNQTREYDVKGFEMLVKKGGMGQYKADWYSDSDPVAREKGYITNYAQSNVNEDFAEMASYMLVYSKEEYDAMLAGIKNENARKLIKAKEQIVVNYYKEQFDMDFYELVRVANENSQKVFNAL